MDEVQHLTRELIFQWHGGKRGAFKAFCDKAEVDATLPDDDSYRRALDELRPNGRISWRLVHRAVVVCLPADRHDATLENLAGLWWRDRGGSPPPGYCGRIVVDGNVIRDELLSSGDAPDDQSRIALLERERDLAQQQLADHRQQIIELRHETDALQKKLAEFRQEAETSQRVFLRHVETVTERLEQDAAERRAEGDRIDSRITMLLDENEDLLRRRETLVQERDEAEARASLHLRQLSELREQAENERRGLLETIGLLEGRIRVLNQELDRVHPFDRPTAAADTNELRRPVDPDHWLGKGDAAPPPVLR
ncbi:hypothetical protein [Micromonospora halophytica]|uniref:Uncharacterized protein n=1 Tax=Micromonospora halophytica TaxID=47864 RepID=A0A1C5IVG5_9ACTN|nr:hypothetical protein [Micromonospora halophytica]SCG61959.1 hypothetical protein GA0070560_116140 [Micromonospora halophytica]